jgi:hypothetical protein
MSPKEEDMVDNIIQVVTPAQNISIPHHLIITISNIKVDTLGMESPKQHQVQAVTCHRIIRQVQHTEDIICLEVLLSVATSGTILCMVNRT